MPQRDIFKGGTGIGTHHTRQPANLFARHWIAFVRHRRTAALFAAEWFFGLAYFGALQVANFQRNFFQRGRQNRQRGEIFRMPVALDHLRRDRRDVQTEPFANGGFHFRPKMRGVAHCAGNFPHGHLPRGVPEAFQVAAVYGKPVGDFQTESDRLGMHAVRAADLRRVLKFARAALEYFSETYEPMLDQSRGFANLQRLRSVNNIIGRQSIVQPARGARIANRFTDGHRERNDVVFHLGFQLRDAPHHAGVDARILSDLFGGFGRHHAALGKRLRCGNFHNEPSPELAFLAPDTAHFFARIS